MSNINTQIQNNSISLQEILDKVNLITISNIYTVSTNEEPNASVGKDGDLMLVVSE